MYITHKIILIYIYIYIYIYIPEHLKRFFIFLHKFLLFDNCNNKDNIISAEVAKILWCVVLFGICLASI
jgi:hypothetical protein